MQHIFLNNYQLCSEISEAVPQHFIHCVATHGRHVQYLDFLHTIIKAEGKYVKKCQDMIMTEVRALRQRRGAQRGRGCWRCAWPLAAGGASRAMLPAPWGRKDPQDLIHRLLLGGEGFEANHYRTPPSLLLLQGLRANKRFGVPLLLLLCPAVPFQRPPAAASRCRGLSFLPACCPALSTAPSPQLTNAGDDVVVFYNDKASLATLLEMMTAARDGVEENSPLMYHISLVDLLAACAEGKNVYTEIKCTSLLPLEDVVRVVTHEDCITEVWGAQDGARGSALIVLCWQHLCPPLPWQVKMAYVNFVNHCYVDTEVEMKEIYTSNHIWTLFENFTLDMALVRGEGWEGHSLAAAVHGDKLVPQGLPRSLGSAMMCGSRSTAQTQVAVPPGTSLGSEGCQCQAGRTEVAAACLSPQMCKKREKRLPDAALEKYVLSVVLDTVSAFFSSPFSENSTSLQV